MEICSLRGYETDYTSLYIPHLGEGKFDMFVPVILTSVGYIFVIP